MEKLDFKTKAIDGKTPLPSDRAWSRASKNVGPLKMAQGPEKYESEGAENGHFLIYTLGP